MPEEIVILGGGVGGTLTANLLDKRLPKGSARIRVVDPTGIHVYQPGFLYVALGRANSGWLSQSLRSLLRPDIEVVIDNAVKIDTASKKVLLERDGEISYDRLVIATGSYSDEQQVPGLREGSYNFYSMAEAERLREALNGFKGGTILIGIAGMPYKCPPAPVEFAFLLDEMLRKKKIRDKTRIRFLSPLNRAFTIESASKMVQPLFEERGIELETFVNVDTVDPEKRELTSIEGETYSYDLAVLIPPHRPASFVTDSGLVDKSGWLAVDPNTLEVIGQEGIYGIGDTTNLPISKSGSTAHFESPVVVEEIRRSIVDSNSDSSQSNQPAKKASTSKLRYKGKVTCFLETGHRKATILIFNYDKPPNPPKPSIIWHLAKWFFNRIYWITVPRGRV